MLINRQHRAHFAASNQQQVVPSEFEHTTPLKLLACSDQITVILQNLTDQNIYGPDTVNVEAHAYTLTAGKHGAAFRLSNVSNLLRLTFNLSL